MSFRERDETVIFCQAKFPIAFFLEQERRGSRRKQNRGRVSSERHFGFDQARLGACYVCASSLERGNATDSLMTV
jgi:hypothetical protein